MSTGARRIVSARLSLTATTTSASSAVAPPGVPRTLRITTAQATSVTSSPLKSTEMTTQAILIVTRFVLVACVNRTPPPLAVSHQRRACRGDRRSDEDHRGYRLVRRGPGSLGTRRSLYRPLHLGGTPARGYRRREDGDYDVLKQRSATWDARRLLRKRARAGARFSLPEAQLDLIGDPSLDFHTNRDRSTPAPQQRKAVLGVLISARWTDRADHHPLPEMSMAERSASPTAGCCAGSYPARARRKLRAVE